MFFLDFFFFFSGGVGRGASVAKHASKNAGMSVPGGTRTRSIAWMTPLVAIMSARSTFDLPLIITDPPSISIKISRRSDIIITCSFVKSPANTSPYVTWYERIPCKMSTYCGSNKHPSNSSPNRANASLL